MVKRPSGKYALRKGLFRYRYLDLRQFFDLEVSIDDVYCARYDSYIEEWCETPDLVGLHRVGRYRMLKPASKKLPPEEVVKTFTINQ